jgi:SAM-dependent methyltransferase
MKNKNTWKPNKYIYRNGKLIASRNPEEVSVASRLIADIVASLYDKYIPVYAKGKLIDLGCGKVPLFDTYKQYVTDNICVDWVNTLHHNDFLDYEYDLTKKLPFNDGEFNTLILSDVLEHIPQPDKLWKEMSRILAPGGIIFINTPFFYFLHETPHDYFRYTEFALRRFAEQSGFNVFCLISIGGAPEILTDILAKLLIHVPGIGTIIAIGFQDVTSFFISTYLGKKISDKTSQKFPLGYFLIAEKISV